MGILELGDGGGQSGWAEGTAVTAPILATVWWPCCRCHVYPPTWMFPYLPTHHATTATQPPGCSDSAQLWCCGHQVASERREDSGVYSERPQAVSGVQPRGGGESGCRVGCEPQPLLHTPQPAVPCLGRQCRCVAPAVTSQLWSSLLRLGRGPSFQDLVP